MVIIVSFSLGYLLALLTVRCCLTLAEAIEPESPTLEERAAPSSGTGTVPRDELASARALQEYRNFMTYDGFAQQKDPE